MKNNLSKAEITVAQNIIFKDFNKEIQKFGYKTFAGMVDVLWKQNKFLKKYGKKMIFTVELPIKGYKPIYKKTIKG